MTNTEKERYRRVRGALLKLLAMQHPGAVDVVVLYRLLDDLGYTISYEEYRSHLAYLAEGCYVRREARSAGGVELEMFVITRHGLNLLDGFGPEDVGVDVRF